MPFHAAHEQLGPRVHISLLGAMGALRPQECLTIADLVNGWHFPGAVIILGTPIPVTANTQIETILLLG